MDEKDILILLTGMTLVTYLPRLLPAWLLSQRTLPEVAVRWLSYIPAAVLAALLLPALLVSDNQFFLSWNNLYLLAAIPTFVVAWKTRSLMGAVLVGMTLVAAGRYFFQW